MSAYAILQGRITDPEQFNQYIEKAGPTLGNHSVKLLAMDEAPTVVEGPVNYLRTVILEFDSEDHFKRWYESPEYRDAHNLRLAASEGTFVLVHGL